MAFRRKDRAAIVQMENGLERFFQIVPQHQPFKLARVIVMKTDLDSLPHQVTLSRKRACRDICVNSHLRTFLASTIPAFSMPLARLAGHG